jgi:signal transduction histidine kinase
MAAPAREGSPAASEPVLPAKYWFPLLVAALVSGAILVVSEISARDFRHQRSELRQAMAVQAKLVELEKLVAEAASGERGYLLTRRAEFLEPYRRSLGQLRAVREQLRDLAAQDRAMRERLADLNELVTLAFAAYQKSIERAAAGDFEAARALIEGDDNLQRTRKLDEQFAQARNLAEQAVAARAAGWQDTLESSRSAILATVGMVAVLIAILALLLIRDTRRARENAAIQASFAVRMNREVAERTAELSALSESLQTRTEEEKAQLARELHDELGGILTPAKMDVNWLEGRLGSDPEVGERLARLAKLLDSGIDVKRRIIENLRPSLLDHLGLPAALHWHVEETCKAAGLEFSLACSEGLERLTPDLEIALYRIVQESLTNIVKHARAKRVEVTVERTSDGLAVSVRDDGEGMSEEAASSLSFGIGGMRQRLGAVGGTLTLQSAPGEGTHVRAFVPSDRSKPRT